MKIIYKNFPIDVVLCILWSIILVPISLLNIEGYIRIILGLPFVIFIPGYILIFALFPTKKTEQGINIIERIALSFGFSIALVPLICLGLNYTSWGIRLESILFTIFIFIIIIGFLAIYRWMKINPDKRFELSLNISIQKSRNKLDYTLNIIIIISIIIAVALPVYILFIPKTGEKFTEFYLVGLDIKSEDYSKNLTQGVPITRTIEILNHEYETINYTIEIWSINHTQFYNESANEIEYTMQNMWFIDKITCTLNHTDITFGMGESFSRIYNYSFAINRSGIFKLAFLLYKTPTIEYDRDWDYINIAQYKINNAYREIHEWINVYYHTPPKANFTYKPGIPNVNDTIYFTSNTTSPDGRIIKWEWDFGDGYKSDGEITGLDFDGINDYVNCGNDLNMQPVVGTIEAWIYPKEFPEIGNIFVGSSGSAYRHPNFRLVGNSLRLILTNNTHQEQHTYNANFILNTWYHVVATWDGSYVRFYMNGKLKETQPQSIIPAGNTVPKRIGALLPPDWPEAFNGGIADIRIYNRTLNNLEIQENFNENITINGLVSWWKLIDDGNIAYDVMGRNNGIIYGASSLNQANHIYMQPSSYTVKLTIKDEYGQIDTISKEIVIT